MLLSTSVSKVVSSEKYLKTTSEDVVRLKASNIQSKRLNATSLLVEINLTAGVDLIKFLRSGDG